jgi:hypothetical protein
MAQPVYKLWQGRYKEAWYELAPEEQQRLLAQVTQAKFTVGGKELLLCSAGWSNEQWPFFGVEEYPDAEAVQRHQQILTELNWGRYLETRTTLGIEFVPPE